MDIINHITANLWELWLAVALVFLIIEMMIIADGSLYVICFSFGALAAAVASVISDNIYVQIIVWCIGTALSVFLIRPAMKKYFHRENHEKKSNTDAIIGRTGRVSEDIEAEGYGRVALDGDDWKAQSEDGSAIAKGSAVEIVSRESLIITVRKV